MGAVSYRGLASIPGVLRGPNVQANAGKEQLFTEGNYLSNSQRVSNTQRMLKSPHFGSRNYDDHAIKKSKEASLVVHTCDPSDLGG